MSEERTQSPPAVKAAMKLLERMDRTEKNLREKLAGKGFSEREIEEAVSHVKSYHYLDDERYASIYIRYHADKKSLTRLRQELSRKGVDRETVELLLETEYEGDEEAQIRALLEKKHFDNSMERKEKERIYAFLLRRGFPSAKILRVMKLPEYDNL